MICGDSRTTGCAANAHPGRITGARGGAAICMVLNCAEKQKAKKLVDPLRNCRNPSLRFAECRRQIWEITVKYLLILSVAFLVSACEGLTPPPPIVADFNGDSVKIAQTNVYGEGKRSEASDAEAARICQTGSRKRAEYASSRQSAQYEITHLYLCL